MITYRQPKNKPHNGKKKASQPSEIARHRARSRQTRARQRAKGLDERTLRRISASIFGQLLHHKQVLSIALVTLGIIYTARMTIHAIGATMAKVRGRGSMKHGIKQVDRFMSNKKLCHAEMRRGFVKAVVGTRKAIDVTMDWTDFDKEGQTTLVLSLVLNHGRAIPLVWHTVKKSTLKNNQTRYERLAIEKLRVALPHNVHVTLIADRGFGNTILYEHLKSINGFDFIIRFRQMYYIEADGYHGKASAAVPRHGTVRVFRHARLTAKRKGPYTVVLVKATKMKESWCIASSLDTHDGLDIVRRYGRRFECEECFRDLKDWRFGLALKHTTIRNEARRERLLFAFALAAFLLTLVGIISERHGCDRLLRANTSKRRTHSLFRQGREIVAGALPPDLERQCLKTLRRLITLALSKGFYHAMVCA